MLADTQVTICKAVSAGCLLLWNDWCTVQHRSAGIAAGSAHTIGVKVMRGKLGMSAVPAYQFMLSFVVWRRIEVMAFRCRTKALFAMHPMFDVANAHVMIYVIANCLLLRGWIGASFLNYQSIVALCTTTNAVHGMLFILSISAATTDQFMLYFIMLKHRESMVLKLWLTAA
jgi:hypothetical protein